MRARGFTVSVLAIAALGGCAAERPGGDFVLTDAARNIDLGPGRLTAADLGMTDGPAWSIRRYRLVGGRQDGVEVIDLDNGRLTARIVPTRGMGVWSVAVDDVTLGWQSPVKEIVHPKFVNLSARGGLGWLEGFGEWMCRCGLESNGLPGVDTIVDNTGTEVSTTLTLHGKIAYLPATEVRISVDPDPPHTLRIFAAVPETMMFGPKLRLTTEISTVPGSTELTIHDTVTNDGGSASEMQLLYHTNYGKPFLAKGHRLVAALKRVTPRDDRAAEGGVENFGHYAGPTNGYVEQVYFLDPKADANGNTVVLLRNKAGDRGTTIRYSTQELKYLTVWKNTASVADGYVTGIEPGTNYPNSRSIERKHGRVPTLEPGASRNFTLTFGVQCDAAAVSAVEKEIVALQGADKPIFDPRPVEGISF